MKKIDKIVIKGANQHNLNNISLSIPRKKLVVFTGVSGSGKSSLVFDTLYAEGHRKYVESLSAYARQFLSRMQKPNVESITGLSPAIAIEQRGHSSNPRSTVGTVTEIYEYIKLLFARIGKTYSPISGEEVRCDNVSSVADFIFEKPIDSKVYILIPLEVQEGRTWVKELEVTLQKGFNRIFHNEEISDIEKVLLTNQKIKVEKTYVLIDRLVIPEEQDEEFIYRVQDSIQTAFNEGHGKCTVHIEDKYFNFSELFEKDGIVFEKPNPHFFNYNSPIGACPTCEGQGLIFDFSTDLIVPNKDLTFQQGAVRLWEQPEMSRYKTNFEKYAKMHGFPLDKPIQDCDDHEISLLYHGEEKLIGIWESIEHYVDTNRNKNLYWLSFYKGKVKCVDCKGTRVKKEAAFVKIHGRSIHDFMQMQIDELYEVFKIIPFTEYERSVGERIIKEVENRCFYLIKVGLEYLTLIRQSSSLSGGESQRVKLATTLGSNLVGSLYILDEPSIGLHPRDADKLVDILIELKNMGNTVIVVEHEETVIQKADYIIDIGPGAGEFGGNVVFEGYYEDLHTATDSITADYLLGRKSVPVPEKRNIPEKFLTLHNCNLNNLRNLKVEVPLNVLTVVTGVSGSGKTSLIKDILYDSLKAELIGNPAKFKITGKIFDIQEIELIDQNALTTNSRSNPVTYLGAFDHIRELFATRADQPKHGLLAHHFSFNVDGGRCDACKGEGTITVEMQFMPDIEIVCEACQGKRYKNHVLEVTVKGKSIFDVLNMSVNEAIDFFEKEPKIVERFKPLKSVGLEYIRLGQTTSTLSGGEAQRLKLASYLYTKNNDNKRMLIFDEPTTGLHFQDVLKLINSFYELIQRGHTVIVIEHNLEVIKCADWILDLGPEGGNKGGYLVFAGTPEDLVKVEGSYTAKYLKGKV